MSGAFLEEPSTGGGGVQFSAYCLEQFGGEKEKGGVDGLPMRTAGRLRLLQGRKKATKGWGRSPIGGKIEVESKGSLSFRGALRKRIISQTKNHGGGRKGREWFLNEGKKMKRRSL